MNSILSALSGGFSKSLLLGTLLPVVIFVLLVLVLVLPYVPGAIAIVPGGERADLEWMLAVITPIVILLTAVLRHFNEMIIRLYEGSPWRDSWLGRWRSQAHRREMNEANSLWKGLWTLLVTPEASQHPNYNEVTDYWNALARASNNLYPDEPEAVLPTRLGNIIRSFESYSWRQYKMRGVTLWPRLKALLDDSYSALIDDAKVSLDFMLNSSLLCGIMAVLIAVVHLAFPVGLTSTRILMTLIVEITVFGGLFCFFYLASIPRAADWAVLHKGAFDLFRGKLLESLGYHFRPESLEEERALWSKISTRLILSDLAIDPLPPYEQKKVAATRVVANPKEVEASRSCVERAVPRSTLWK